MDDLSWLTDYIDPRVAAASVAVMEYLKGFLPERYTKGRAVRFIALIVVAACYGAFWAATVSDDMRRIGTGAIAIVGTYLLSKIGYEAARKVGPELPEVQSEVQEVVVTPPRVPGSDVPVTVSDAPRSPQSHETPQQESEYVQPERTRHGAQDVTRGG